MTTHDPVRFVAKNMRVDLRLIAEMIAPGTRVLDILWGKDSRSKKLVINSDTAVPMPPEPMPRWIWLRCEKWGTLTSEACYEAIRDR